MERNRNYYEQLFKTFDDVVKMPDFRKMLGGISEKATYVILRSEHLRHFNIDAEYFFPKVWVIDYVLGEHYARYKQSLSVQI